MSNKLPLIPGLPETGPRLTPSVDSHGLGRKAVALAAAAALYFIPSALATADSTPATTVDKPKAGLSDTNGQHSEAGRPFRHLVPSAIGADGGPITIKVAKKLLNKADLDVGGFVPLKPKAGYIVSNFVSGFAKKVQRPKKDGKIQPSIYVPLPSGKRLNHGADVYIKRKIVKNNISVVPPTPGVIGTTPTNPGLSPPPNPEVAPPPVPTELSPGEIKQKVNEYIKNNVARLPFARNCTGLVIRNDQGVPVAVVTVQHCGLNPDQKPRVRNAQGELEIAIGESLDVMVGGDGSVTELKSIGKVHEAYVPIRGQDSDLVVFAFKGHSALEGFTRYRQSIISDQDLANIDNILLPGYPVEQRKSATTFRSPSELRRVTMDVTKLTNRFTDFKIHTEIADPLFRQDLNALVTGINPDPEKDEDPVADAICSGGNSGAVGLSPKVSGSQVTMKTVGLDIGFDVFNYRYLHTIHVSPPAIYDPIAVLRERQASLDSALGQDPNNRDVDLGRFAAACYLGHGLEPLQPYGPNGPTTAQINRVFEKVKIRGA